MKHFFCSLVLVFSLFFSATCLAATVSGNDPQTVLEIAKGFGSATLAADGLGDPKISGRIDGVKYNLYFYNCKDHKNCDTLQFTAGWSGYAVTMEDINKWNSDMLYGKVYLDEDNDPILELAVVAEEMPAAYLEEWFEWWQVAVAEFTKTVLLPAKDKEETDSPAQEKDATPQSSTRQ